MGKWCLHASLFLGNKDMFKNYKRFDFWHVQTADGGGTKPWKNNCSLIWKLFKFLMTLLAGLFEMKGCWHIGLRWAIVALWATCFYLVVYVPTSPLFQRVVSKTGQSEMCSVQTLKFWIFRCQFYGWQEYLFHKKCFTKLNIACNNSSLVMRKPVCCANCEHHKGRSAHSLISTFVVFCLDCGLCIQYFKTLVNQLAVVE